MQKTHVGGAGTVGLFLVPIEIIDHDATWPRQFEEEKRRILAAIGRYVAAVEHVGSTAVPGPRRETIMVILVGLRSLADATNCIDPLKGLGYEYVPQCEAELPERRYFRRVVPRPGTHHIHMVETTSEFWRRQLLFRDYLRAHLEDARAYEALKRGLASRFEVGRDYAAAKSVFISAILDKADRASTVTKNS